MKTKITLALFTLVMGLMAGQYQPAPVRYTNQPPAWNLDAKPGGQMAVLVLTNNIMPQYYFADLWVTNVTTAAAHIETARAEMQLTNLVNLLVSSGEFCKARGHVWGIHLHVTLEYRTDKYEERECKVCGKVESRSMPAWSEP